MKKVITIILVLVLLWIVKLSYDSYQISDRLDDLQQSLTKVENSNANLNDQLAAMQRQGIAPHEQQDKPQISPNVVNGLHPTELVRQQLELIQLALQDQQYTYALDKLNHLDATLANDHLAPALTTGLKQSLSQDRKIIQQYVLSKDQQQQRFDDLIQSIDENLQKSQHYSTLSVERNNQHFWQGWFKVERVEQPSAELVERRLILKEVQLRLLLARQALNDNHLTEYQHLLNLAGEQLNTLPDATSKKILLQLQQLKKLQFLAVPKLTSIGLVE